jgi:NAD(P)-dependent dehydrogenase (short-subunit alcohol dehydrogenase family)
MHRLTNKVAIVSGAAHGIGRAIAEAFAAEGAHVVVTDIDSSEGEIVAASIREQGQSAVFLRCDVTATAEVVECVRRTIEWKGPVEILCNNAAYLGDFHGALDATEEEWERCIQVALMGTHRFTQAVLPSMLEKKQGSIVNIASVQALAGCPTSVAYTATKSAILGFTISAAYDYGPQNIRVNAICPGPIQTRISPKPGDPAYNWQCEQTMLHRVGYPIEIAAAAVFLASEESSYITGVTLPVDGGWAAK